MRRRMTLISAGLAIPILGIGAIPGTVPAVQPAGTSQATSRFEVVDVYVDSGATPLAAYQLEVRAVVQPESAGIARLVGIEGGEAEAYQQPPYYDSALLHASKGAERVVLLGYSLNRDSDLPSGRVRVARIHMELPPDGEPTYECVLTVAGDSMARAISATAAVKPTPGSPALAPPAPGQAPAR